MAGFLRSGHVWKSSCAKSAADQWVLDIGMMAVPDISSLELFMMLMTLLLVSAVYVCV